MPPQLTKRLLSGNEESGAWRTAPPFTTENLESLKKRIEDFSPPPALNLLHARILLIGMTQSGKSSTCNTMSAPFRGRQTQQAVCGSTVGSFTTEYQQYRIHSALRGKTLNFYLCDTCGIEEKLGPQTNEFEYLLEGHLPIGYKFNQGSKVMSWIFRFKKKRPKLEDKVHCVVLVIDGSSVNIMPEWAWDKLNQIQSGMNKTGIPRLVFLTKIDKMSKTIADDLSKVFQSCEVKKVVEKVTQRLGVPENYVMPIKNYSNSTDLEEKTSILALTALDKALSFAEDFLLAEVERLERNKNGQMDQFLFFVIAGCIVFITLVVYIYAM